MSDPKGYEELNPENGWGSYEGALRWLKEWRDNVALHPDAKIGVSR